MHLSLRFARQFVYIQRFQGIDGQLLLTMAARRSSLPHGTDALMTCLAPRSGLLAPSAVSSPRLASNDKRDRRCHVLLASLLPSFGVDPRACLASLPCLLRLAELDPSFSQISGLPMGMSWVFLGGFGANLVHPRLSYQSCLRMSDERLDKRMRPPPHSRASWPIRVLESWRAPRSPVSISIRVFPLEPSSLRPPI